MAVKISDRSEIVDFLKVASGEKGSGGNPRAKRIIHRLLSDLLKAIEDLDITPEEFWVGVNYLNDLGAAGEAGLLAAGSGLEHLLDVRMDAQDEAAGIKAGTSRTIEGPLYVGGAPMSVGTARLDDGSDPGKVLFMHGVVRDGQGAAVSNAVVDVWHANTKGMYSFFDSSQPSFNLRRRIRTDEQGRYEFRSIVPSGYGCPPDGPTQAYLNAIGRHGRRPAHIHFFVSASGYRYLTTQINIKGERYLHDDFAFATRDDLIVDMVDRVEATGVPAIKLDQPFAEIEFDFVLSALPTAGSDRFEQNPVKRRRVAAA
jgi:catechol 1,2-dioxygenase